MRTVIFFGRKLGNTLYCDEIQFVRKFEAITSLHKIEVSIAYVKISSSFVYISLKELRHGQRILKKLASIFKFVDSNRSLSSSVETILGYFRVFTIPLVFFYIRKLLF